MQKKKKKGHRSIRRKPEKIQACQDSNPDQLCGTGAALKLTELAREPRGSWSLNCFVVYPEKKDQMFSPPHEAMSSGTRIR